MRDCPCHNCPRRSAICHAHCEEYPAWAAELTGERRPGPVAEALLVGWAMLWAAIYEGAEALTRWRREG